MSSVFIGGVPVQFVPPFNALLKEAPSEAVGTRYEHTPTRVPRAEHLIAIAVQTGRNKDRQRVRLLLEHAPVDTAYLTEILARHDLARIIHDRSGNNPECTRMTNGQ
jgi:hypothetical protein